MKSLAGLKKAGDYYGPTSKPNEGSDERPSVWFLLPIARDPDVPATARGLRRVTTPPHVFRECPDGSLEIRESIAAYGYFMEVLWHGYLDEGHVWREV